MTENRARIFFGGELRRMRDNASLTGKQLADALGCTPQWISMMESGRKVSEQSAHDLDTFFKTDGHFHRHWKLINDVELQTYLPPGFAEYVEEETKANSVRAFSGFLVNGLFQTEDYAAAVMGTAHGSRVSEMVANRIERQAIFQREDPPLVWLTIDEVILHRVIGSTQVMRGQLEALWQASEKPGVVIEVMPLRAGYHVGLTGDFTMLSFGDGTSVAYTESSGIGTLVRMPDKVADFVVRWDSLRGYALPIEESRAAIKAAMEAL